MVWVLIIQVWRYLQEAQCPSVPVKEVQGGFELHEHIKRNIFSDSDSDSDRVTICQTSKVYITESMVMIVLDYRCMYMNE